MQHVYPINPINSICVNIVRPDIIADKLADSYEVTVRRGASLGAGRKAQA